MIRITTHANQQMLWSTPITKSFICTFLILLHGYTVHYSGVSLSSMPNFFFKFLRRKPWTCCVLIQNCLDLLHFGLNIKLWSPIAHAHKFLFPLLLYTIRFVSEFNSFLIFLDLLRFTIQLFRFKRNFFILTYTRVVKINIFKYRMSSTETKKVIFTDLVNDFNWNRNRSYLVLCIVGRKRIHKIRNCGNCRTIQFFFSFFLQKCKIFRFFVHLGIFYSSWQLLSHQSCQLDISLLRNSCSFWSEVSSGWFGGEWNGNVTLAIMLTQRSIPESNIFIYY